MLTKDEVQAINKWWADAGGGTSKAIDAANKAVDDIPALCAMVEKLRNLLNDILFWHSLLPQALVDAIRAAVGKDS